MSATNASETKPATDKQQPIAQTVSHYTVAERMAQGKSARAEVARQTLGDWEPATNRPDPVDLLEEQAKTRVTELVPIRYGRMVASPFAFYRGAAAIMAADLSDSPRTGLDAQLCGDAHLSNFGIYEAPDRRLVFSVNDFDETLLGPFEWDVKRLAASFAIAGRDRGFDTKVRARINDEVGRSYRKAMSDFAAMRTMNLWYARLDVDDLAKAWRKQLTTAQRKQVQKTLEHARLKDSLRALSKLTQTVDGQPRIISDPPLIVPIEELAKGETEETLQEKFRVLIRTYRRTLEGDRRRLLERFRYVDAARKVVGVGSVGTRAWIVLLVGRDENDPLFMQVKEAQASVLAPYLRKSPYSSHGQRVVEGQRMIETASDLLLGWITTDGLDGVKRDFYVRQLWDGKGSANVDAMTPKQLTKYARMCGTMLADAHARSGDAVALAAYLGTNRAFEQAMSAFAEVYADQNERDYDALTEAVKSGRVTAETGV